VRPLLLAVLLFVVAASGCTQPHSKRCKEVCQREAECVDSTKSATPFEEKECVAACAVLEGDRDNLAKVERHASCVAAQPSCAAVLECK
jgi:hypothetical protein